MGEYKEYQSIPADKPLTIKEQKFCNKYLETGNCKQAALYAGYSPRTADSQGTRLLNKPNVKRYLGQLREGMKSEGIATAQEVMEYFTKVMRGEIKDQFGLEPSLSERTKAAQEVVKRTFDLEQKQSGTADSVIQIKLDWSR